MNTTPDSSNLYANPPPVLKKSYIPFILMGYNFLLSLIYFVVTPVITMMATPYERRFEQGFINLFTSMYLFICIPAGLFHLITSVFAFLRKKIIYYLEILSLLDVSMFGVPIVFLLFLYVKLKKIRNPIKAYYLPDSVS